MRGLCVWIHRVFKISLAMLVSGIRWCFAERRRRTIGLLLLTCVIAILITTHLKWRSKTIASSLKILKPSHVIGSKEQKPNIDKSDLLVEAEKWIFVNGTGLSAQSLTNIRDVHGWRILIHRKDGSVNKAQLRCKNCLMVDIRDTANMKDKIQWLTDVPLLNVVLFMLERKAKWIYVTNTSERMASQIEPFSLNDTRFGIVCDKYPFYPQEYFVNPRFRDRSIYFNVTYWSNVRIQTRYVRVDKLWNKVHACNALPVLVSENQYGVFPLTSTLYEYSTFWSLVTMIWPESGFLWSLWTQTLLHEMRASMSIFPPTKCSVGQAPVRKRATPVLALWKKTTHSFSCNDTKSLFECALRLTKMVENAKTIPNAVTNKIMTWLKALKKINYPDPKIFDRRASPSKYVMNLVHNPRTFYIQNTSAIPNPFAETCDAKQNMTSHLQYFKNVILVVFFENSKDFGNIKRYHFLYTRYFSKVVYCGPDLPRFLEVYNSFGQQINFLSLPVESKWVMGHLCFDTVIRMGFNAKGYLFTSNGVLLNFKQLANLSQNKIWLQPLNTLADLSASKAPDTHSHMNDSHWLFWERGHGLTRLREIWKKLEMAKYKKVISGFRYMLEMNSGKERRYFYGESELLFLPQRYRDSFLFLSKIFLDGRVIPEIALPTILFGLELKSNIIQLRGDLRDSKANCKVFYDLGDHFLNRCKSAVIKNTPHEQFICRIYLPTIV